MIFQHEIGDKVRLLALGCDGHILQRCDRGAGVVDYQVVWWWEGKRNADWLLPFEIGPGDTGR